MLSIKLLSYGELTRVDVPPDWMNELQHLSMKDHGPVLVTLNPPFDPEPALEFGRYKYDHPILSDEASSPACPLCTT